MTGKKLKKGRREFLRQGLVGVASASLLPSFSKDKSKAIGGKKSAGDKKIIYRTLGRTEIKVPLVSIGASNSVITRAALDAGVVHLDTAYRYGGGTHEAMLGGILKGRPRNSFVIATKIIPLLDHQTGLPPKDIGPARFRAHFRKKLDVSLKRLQLDYVDILYLHAPEKPELIRLQLVKDVMLELKKEGKAHFLGVSFHHKELELIPATVEEKIYDVILTSYNFRQPHKEKVKEAIADAAKAGLGIVSMKIMAGAYWDRERKHPINAKAALKWVLQDKNVHTTIPSIDTLDQLEQDMSVMEDLALTIQEKKDLKLGKKTAMTGLYCAQCGRCRSQCRYNLDIPTVMRSYMYAYGYNNPAKAKETLEQKNREEITCRACSTCGVSCTMGFDVPGKIRDIAHILDVPHEFLA